MRRYCLLLALLLPLLTHAQQKPVYRTELAANIGHAFNNVIGTMGVGDAFRGHLSLLRNRGRFQYGVTVEGGVNGDWYLAPGLLGNYRIIGKSGYWYGGAMAGYNAYRSIAAWDFSPRSFDHGYVFGLQTGYARQLGSRWMMNAEAGVRSSCVWRRYPAGFGDWYQKYGDEPFTISRVVTYLPVTIGVRYRIGASGQS